MRNSEHPAPSYFPRAYQQKRYRRRRNFQLILMKTTGNTPEDLDLEVSFQLSKTYAFQTPDQKSPISSGYQDFSGFDSLYQWL